ncbi:cysteine proteinase [Marasmius fiardii PR-910]|nr:cysteine proteinase [Marasmius fiardii PR-910]
MLNTRKRPAPEPIIPINIRKQPRTSLFNNIGEKQSPSSNHGLLSRWKGFAKDFVDLGRDTFSFLLLGEEKQKSHSRPFRNSPSNPIVISSSPEPSLITREELIKTPRTNSFSTPRRNSGTYTSEISEAAFTSRSFSFPSSSTPRNISPALIPPPPFSSSRKRKLGAMGPPPEPSNLHSISPYYVPSEGTLSGRSTPRSVVERELRTLDIYPKRSYQHREHIYAAQHKRAVEVARKTEIEISKELYILKQRKGYRSDFETFKGFLDYQSKLESMNGNRRDILSPSPSLGNIRSRFAADAEPSRPRRHSDTADTKVQWLERQLEMARQTIFGPKPPLPFHPSLEQLRIRERAKDGEIEERLRPKRAPLPKSLSPEEDAQVNAFLKKRGVISKYAREQVTDQDIVRLRPGSWLNDEIINFYGAMILGRSESCKGDKENKGSSGKPLDAWYFSSFFWSKLEKEGYDKGRLAKWTKKIDIFSKDVILIPVNHNNMHWTGAAINFRRRRIESHDSMNTMDRSRVFKHLRAYLDAEHRNKKKTPFDFSEWNDYTSGDTPQQENGYDCGVFTCQFLESLSRGEETFNFTQSDIPYLRRRMIWEIGNAKLKEVP